MRILEDLSRRLYKGAQISYLHMFREVIALLNDLQYEIVNFFPPLVDNIIGCVEKILHDRYLKRRYIDVSEDTLTPAGAEIRKNYRRLVSLQDSFRAVRKARLSKEGNA